MLFMLMHLEWSVWNSSLCKAAILQGLLEALKRSVLIEVNEGGNVRPDHAARPRCTRRSMQRTCEHHGRTRCWCRGFGVSRGVSSPGCPKPAEF